MDGLKREVGTWECSGQLPTLETNEVGEAVRFAGSTYLLRYCIILIAPDGKSLVEMTWRPDEMKGRRRWRRSGRERRRKNDAKRAQPHIMA